MKSWSVSRLMTTAVFAVLGIAIFASAAAAKGGGQLESWGTKGSAEGQLFNPGMFGVDPSNGTVYTGDLSSDKKNFRVQQFSPTGEFKASVAIPRMSGEALLAMHGVAVDPGLERIYVIESCKVGVGLLTCKKTGSIYGAKRILVYSTKAEGGKLVADKTTPAIALPSGENEIYFPQTVGIDPTTHDIVVFGEDANHHTLIQRFSSSGVAGARFVDTEDKLRPTKAANPSPLIDSTSIAVAPNGTTYTMTGNPGGPGRTRAWQLPANLSKVEQVPGFAAVAEDESWFDPMISRADELIGGPQIAVSTDGGTLYWKERILDNEGTEAGNILVRGYSLSKNQTSSLWGNGTSTCKITTTNAGLAAAPGGKLAVFDYGQPADSPAFGVKVLTFGAAGTGCPEPKAKFTINGKKEGEEPTGIKPGETVTLDAASSELLGGFRRELIWKFGDGTEKTVKFTAGSEGESDKEAVTSVTHTYASAAKVTVRLEIKLREAHAGNPEPVERTFTVGSPATPKFKVKVLKSGTGNGTVSSSPSGINCGVTCEAEFEEGKKVTLTQVVDAGSEFKGWSGAGCTGTGTCEVTVNAAKEVTAQYALEQHPLTVTETGSGSGTVTSSPSGINCGPTCVFSFTHNTPVTLSGAADVGSSAVVWGSCDEIVGSNECKVTIGAAREVTAAFELSGGEGGLYCDGVNISGAGTALQLAPHNTVWGPVFPASVCPGGASVSYAAGSGIPQWTGTIDHGVSFIGSDEAPTAAQIAAIKSAAGAGVQLAVIPVAQTAIAVIANPPAGCTVEEVTSGDLTALFEGRFKTWSQLDTADGTCAAPITRVVPKDAEGATTQLKNYLYQLNKKGLACAPAKATWQGLIVTNTVWPEGCPEKALSALVRPATDGGAAEAAKVKATAGAIGFAALPDAEAAGAQLLRLQNNGYAPVLEATYASPQAGSTANCSTMTYKTPAGGGGLGLDWSAVFGARPAIGSGYPLCTLTYVLAFHGYEAAGFTVGQERTVKDYINGYVVTDAGQAAVANGGFAALPSSGAPRADVLGEARKAASKIIR